MPFILLLWKIQKRIVGSHTPLGHNVLKNYVRNMQKAGIESYKTNHSLGATAATQLHLNGPDEQLVMEQTEHHSIEGVRSYIKRISKEQQENRKKAMYRCRKER